MWIWAEGEIPVADLGQYGIAGLIASIFLWFAWQVYKRERDRADRLELEKEKLWLEIKDTFIPAMEASKAALLESNQLLAEAKARRRA